MGSLLACCDDVKKDVDFEGVLDTHGATHGAEHTHGATHGAESTCEVGGKLGKLPLHGPLQQTNSLQTYISTILRLQGHSVDKLSNSKTNGDYMIAF